MNRLNTCPACGGAAVVIVVRRACINGESTELPEPVPCGTCDGSGQVVDFSG